MQSQDFLLIDHPVFSCETWPTTLVFMGFSPHRDGGTLSKIYTGLKFHFTFSTIPVPGWRGAMLDSPLRTQY